MKIKFLSIFLTCIYTITQVVLGSAAEANIWKERQKSIKENQKIASIPTGMRDGTFQNALWKQLPKIQSTLSKSTTKTENVQKKHPVWPSDFQTLIDAVPHHSGRIKDVHYSGHSHEPTVVIIQDIHLNPEAQFNIATVLQNLINTEKINQVGIEGAFSRFDFSQLRQSPDTDKKAQVSKEFLEDNLIAAHTFVGINSKVNPPPFIGIDDKSHHAANVEAYLNTRNTHTKTTNSLKKIQTQLENKKQNIFNENLLSFDTLRSRFNEGKINLGEYLKEANHQQHSSMMIDHFLSAYEMETKIDFNQVEAERRQVIQKLTEVLSKDEIQNLITQSLGYKLGKLDFGTYYTQLRELCTDKRISLRQTPAFDNYIRYVLLSDGINVDQLFKEIEEMEINIVQSLAKTDEEKRLIEKSEWAYLSQKLIQFQLTPNEWEKYKAIVHGTRYTVHNNDPMYRVLGTVYSYERFYEEAEIRSHKMVENLLNPKLYTLNSKKNKNSKLEFSVQNLEFPKSMILITGGFHTPDIAQQFKDQNVSYIMVQPKITKVDLNESSSYLSIFEREKKSLLNIFAGRKLFISPDAVYSVGSHNPHPTAQSTWNTLKNRLGVTPVKLSQTNILPLIETFLFSSIFSGVLTFSFLNLPIIQSLLLLGAGGFSTILLYIQRNNTSQKKYIASKLESFETIGSLDRHEYLNEMKDFYEEIRGAFLSNQFEISVALLKNLLINRNKILDNGRNDNQQFEGFQNQLARDIGSRIETRLSTRAQYLTILLRAQIELNQLDLIDEDDIIGTQILKPIFERMNSNEKMDLVNAVLPNFINDNNSPSTINNNVVMAHQDKTLMEKLKNKSPPIYDLLFSKQHLIPFLQNATFLRYMFDYRLYADKNIPPLQYALDNGFYFKLSDGLYFTPVSSSFRRYIIFEMDDGLVGPKVEIKIPGLHPQKRKTLVNGYTYAKLLEEEYPNEFLTEKTIALMEIEGTIEMYGQDFKMSEEQAPRVLVMEYEEDANRLDVAEVNDQDQFQTAVQMVILIAKVHAIQLKMARDGNIGNFRYGRLGLTFAGDFEGYKPESDERFFIREMEGALFDYDEKFDYPLRYSQKQRLRRIYEQVRENPQLTFSSFEPPDPTNNDLSVAATWGISYWIARQIKGTQAPQNEVDELAEKRVAPVFESLVVLAVLGLAGWFDPSGIVTRLIIGAVINFLFALAHGKNIGRLTLAGFLFHSPLILTFGFFPDSISFYAISLVWAMGSHAFYNTRIINRNAQEPESSVQSIVDPRREINEDNALQMEGLWDGEVALEAVLDGAGGLEGAARSTQLAKDVLQGMMKLKLSSKPSNISTEKDLELVLIQTLTEAMREADQVISRTPRAGGTTATVSLVWTRPNGDRRIITAQAGDTRAYLKWKNGKFKRLTIDNMRDILATKEIIPQFVPQSYMRTMNNYGYVFIDHDNNLDESIQEGIEFLDWMDSVNNRSNLNSSERSIFEDRHVATNGLFDGNHLPVIFAMTVPAHEDVTLIHTTDGIHDPLTTNELKKAINPKKSAADQAHSIIKATQNKNASPQNIMDEFLNLYPLLSTIFADLGLTNPPGFPIDENDPTLNLIREGRYHEVKTSQIFKWIELSLETLKNNADQIPTEYISFVIEQLEELLSQAETGDYYRLKLDDMSVTVRTLPGKSKWPVASIKNLVPTFIKIFIINWKINSHKKSLASLATQNAELKMDLERARNRFDRLKELLPFILQVTPDRRDEVINQFLNPLLELETEHINFILGSSLSSSLGQLFIYSENREGFTPQNVEDHIDSLTVSKVRWVRAKSFRYLEGLPIIFEDDIDIKLEIVKDEDKELYLKIRDQFPSVADALRRSVRRNPNPHIQQAVRSISSIRLMDLGKDTSASADRRGFVNVNIHAINSEILATLVHEGSHIALYNTDWLQEVEDDELSNRHVIPNPGFDNPGVELAVLSNALHEAHARAVEALFSQELYKSYQSNPERYVHFLQRGFNDFKRTVKALTDIEELELNDVTRKWITEIKRLWLSLDEPFTIVLQNAEVPIENREELKSLIQEIFSKWRTDVQPNFQNEISAFNQGETPNLPALLSDIVRGTDLDIRVRDLTSQRQLRQYADISEVVSQELKDQPAQSRKFSNQLWNVITKEETSQTMFAGSYGAFNRDIEEGDVVIHIIDEDNLSVSLEQARTTLKNAKPGTKTIFITPSGHLSAMLFLNEAIENSNLDALVLEQDFSDSFSTLMEDSIDFDFLTEDDFKKRNFKFIFPTNQQDYVAQLISDIDMSDGRFRLFVILLESINPLVVEFRPTELDQIDDITNLIMSQA